MLAAESPCRVRNPELKTTAFDPIRRPFGRFTAAESTGSVVLLACAAAALLWANSPWAQSYFDLWVRTLTIGLDSWALSKTLRDWINEGLMAVFLLRLGLEIKREWVAGELGPMRQAAVPFAAAIGGMSLAGAIFVVFNRGNGMIGAAIPMATDVALALGVLSLLGTRAPSSLKVFLAASAIIADIGAILLAATHDRAAFSPLGVAIAGAAVLGLAECNRSDVRRPMVYAGLGCLLWIAAAMSGIHGSIAGVVLAIAMPARLHIDVDQVIDRTDIALVELEQASRTQGTELPTLAQHEALLAIERVVTNADSPILKIERALHRTVALGIAPLFVLANAGLSFRGDALDAVNWRVVIGIALGLMIGKSIGITTTTWIVLRLASPLATVQWRTVHGVAWLGGIGFTMSLFVAGLVFDDAALLASAKLGIFGGSLLAGIMGLMMLQWAAARSRASDAVIPLRQTSVGLT